MRFTKILAPIFFAATLFAANPSGVPKDARQTAPGEYSFRDADGKNWVYKQTPFGIQKSEDKGKSAAASASAASEQQKPAPAPGTPTETPFGQVRNRTAATVRVTEDGDNLRFERQTPFGVQRWTKSKSDLTQSESQMWDAQRNSTNSTSSK